MKKFIKFSLLALVVMSLFVGCRTAPLHNYDSQSLSTSDKVTLENVEKAIIRAGASLGWQMKKVKDGEIVGTLHLRKHMAQVSIPYTTKTYSIIYKASSQLNYDDSDKTIHSNYNGWVQNLNNAILIQIGIL